MGEGVLITEEDVAAAEQAAVLMNRNKLDDCEFKRSAGGGMDTVYCLDRKMNCPFMASPVPYARNGRPTGGDEHRCMQAKKSWNPYAS